MNDQPCTVKDAQKVMLAILLEFDRICQKHSLVYWLDFGTLLGAKRYKGFIPWDDDLDVGMPKEDYEKFLHIAESELDNRYFLQTRKRDKYYRNFFAKIRDRNSLLIDKWEKERHIKYHQGIYIDIFPAMRVSKKSLESPLFRGLVYLSKLTHNRYIHLDILTSLLIRAVNAFEDKKGHYLISSGETMHYLKPVKTEDFFPLQKILFEGLELPAPKNETIYLKAIFGDQFMVPPVPEKRISHSQSIYLNKKCYKEVENEADSCCS